MKKVHGLIKGEREFYESQFEDLVKGIDLSKPISILDYGSGTGGFASLLAEKYPQAQITAIDSNQEIVELGKEHYKDLENLEFVVGNKIPDKKYDIIFKNLVLHELDGKGEEKEIKKSLKKAYESLNEGGLISILDNRKVSEEEFRPIYEENKNPQRGSFDEEFKEHTKYSTNDWLEMLDKIGFEKKHHKEISPNLFHYIGKKK